MEATFGLLDITRLLVWVVLTLASIPRVRSLTQSKVGDMLTLPLLGAHDHGSAAKRCQYWLLASVFHSLTMIRYICKDYSPSTKPEVLWDWILFGKCLGPLLNLIVSCALLVLLARHYPVTEDLLVAGIIVGFGFISYLLIYFTDKMCLESTIIWEIMLIPITMCVNLLRFASQGPSTRFELIPFSVALVGATPAILCLIPQKISDASNVLSAVFKHLMQDHLPYNMATLLGAAFRILYVIFIWSDKTRDTGNYFRSILQECFL